MTRTPHDQFAKQYLEELLTLLGKVETSRDVASEVREIDVYFIPVIPPPNDPKILGLLGQMATTASVYEPFRNQPQRLEILDCQAKLNFVINQQKRKSRRENTSYPETEWPLLWILCPSCSAKLIDGFAAQPDPGGKWPTGVYFFARISKHSLSRNQSTTNQSGYSLVEGFGKKPNTRASYFRVRSSTKRQPTPRKSNRASSKLARHNSIQRKYR